jgi:hypothetical protein
MQQVMLRRTDSLKTTALIDKEHKTRSQLSQASPTSAPGQPTSEAGHRNICAGDHWLPRPLLRKSLRLRAAHACDGTRAPTLDMSVTAAVFQLPMFWLNAYADINACRADPTPSTPQRTKPSPPATPHRAAPATHRVAVYNDAASGASSHKRRCNKPALVDSEHKIR